MQTLTQLARAIIAADRAGELTDELFNEFELALDATEQPEPAYDWEAAHLKMAERAAALEVENNKLRQGIEALRIVQQPAPAVPDGWRDAIQNASTVLCWMATRSDVCKRDMDRMEAADAALRALLSAAPQPKEGGE
ncbi:hypothetical protein [Chromobacterium amazonense]|uniref:hypothetical protein n=1 Tax=Chromobacterium amazonense TaxID=1382803 RepID=UPI003F7A62E4